MGVGIHTLTHTHTQHFIKHKGAKTQRLNGLLAADERRYTPIFSCVRSSISPFLPHSHTPILPISVLLQAAEIFLDPAAICRGYLLFSERVFGGFLVAGIDIRIRDGGRSWFVGRSGCLSCRKYPAAFTELGFHSLYMLYVVELTARAGVGIVAASSAAETALAAHIADNIALTLALT